MTGIGITFLATFLAYRLLWFFYVDEQERKWHQSGKRGRPE